MKGLKVQDVTAFKRRISMVRVISEVVYSNKIIKDQKSMKKFNFPAVNKFQLAKNSIILSATNT